LGGKKEEEVRVECTKEDLRGTIGVTSGKDEKMRRAQFVVGQIKSLSRVPTAYCLQTFRTNLQGAEKPERGWRIIPSQENVKA